MTYVHQYKLFRLSLTVIRIPFQRSVISSKGLSEVAIMQDTVTMFIYRGIWLFLPKLNTIYRPTYLWSTCEVLLPRQQECATARVSMNWPWPFRLSSSFLVLWKLMFHIGPDRQRDL